MQPQDTLAEKLRPQVLWRQSQLFAGHEEKIHDKHVIELAPGHGLFSERILTDSPKTLTLIEADEQQAQLLRDFHAADPRVKVLSGDAHRTLTNDFGKVDTIVCAGLLYHTPHPLWLLENMARLSPRYILIDTACAPANMISARPELTNQHGYRQVVGPHAGLALLLPPEIYLSSMLSLGYKAVARVNTNPIPDSQVSGEAREILFGWQRCFSYWFEKI